MFDPRAVLTHLDRLEQQVFDWGALTWLCNDKLMPGAAQTFGLCHILPGKGNPRHYHPNCEEILHVLAGTGAHCLEDQWFDLGPGTTIRIPIGARHNLKNIGNDVLTCVIAFSSGDRQTVFLE